MHVQLQSRCISNLVALSNELSSIKREVGAEMNLMKLLSIEMIVSWIKLILLIGYHVLTENCAIKFSWTWNVNWVSSGAWRIVLRNISHPQQKRRRPTRNNSACEKSVIDITTQIICLRVSRLTCEPHDEVNEPSNQFWLPDHLKTTKKSCRNYHLSFRLSLKLLQEKIK